MVDITSLKARLARLRLASDIQEEAKHDRRLEDPVTTERKKFKKKTKKAAKIRKTENEYDPSKPREGFSKKEYEGLKKIRAEQIRMKKNSSYIPKAAPKV